MKIRPWLCNILGFGLAAATAVGARTDLRNAPKILIKPDTLFFAALGSKASVLIFNQGNSPLRLDSLKSENGYSWIFDGFYQNARFEGCISLYWSPCLNSSRIEIAAFVSLVVCNLRGQRVAELIAGVMPAGNQSISWDGTRQNGRPLPAGIYVYQLAAGPVKTSKRLLLLR